MNTRNLIDCDNCKLLGKKTILAELTSTGAIIVMRKRSPIVETTHFTIIKANDFSIICGACLHPANITFIYKNGETQGTTSGTVISINKENNSNNVVQMGAA